jgi:hypothetical protein
VPRSANPLVVYFDTFFVKAASFAAFFVVAASTTSFSAAAFAAAATASSMTFFAMAAVAAYLSAVAFSTVCVSTTGGVLPLDPPSTITFGTGSSAGVGPPTMDPALQINLSCLCSRASSLDDTSSSLAMTRIAFLLPLLGAVVVSPRPWPPTVSVPGIYTPRDSLPFCYTAMPMSSSVGSSHNNYVRIGWSEHTGAQPGRG